MALGSFWGLGYGYLGRFKYMKGENEFYFLSILIGQVMPYVSDFFNRYFAVRSFHTRFFTISSSTIRFWISVLLCTGVAFLMNYDGLSFVTKKDFYLSALTIWFSAQAAYQTYYEHSQLQYKIRRPVIE